MNPFYMQRVEKELAVPEPRPQETVDGVTYTPSDALYNYRRDAMLLLHKECPEIAAFFVPKPAAFCARGKYYYLSSTLPRPGSSSQDSYIMRADFHEKGFQVVFLAHGLDFVCQTGMTPYPAKGSATMIAKAITEVWLRIHGVSKVQKFLAPGDDS